MKNAQLIRDVKNAARNKYTSMGCYPLFIGMTDGAALCCGCARAEFGRIGRATRDGARDGWAAECVSVNYEDAELFCDHCNERIESAYAEDSPRLTLDTNLAEMRAELIAELKRLQTRIGDEYRASDDDTAPSMQVTLGINDTASEYALQTGDNSYTGAAYGFPHWGVSALYRDSDAHAVAAELIDQCSELAVAALDND